MKNTMIMAAALASAYAMGQTTQSPASPIGVTIDGSPLESAVAPTRVAGRVLVPLRGIFEKMGAKVSYDQAAGTVIASKGDHTTQLTVGSDKATVDGREITLPTPMRPMNGSVMVPLRFVSESLGAKVDYDAAMSQVVITSPADTTPSMPSETPTPPPSTGEVPYTEPGAVTTPPPVATPPVIEPPVAAAPTTATPPPMSQRPERISPVEADPAATANSFDFLKVLPWVLGLIILGVAGAALMAARARKGGVIASKDDHN